LGCQSGVLARARAFTARRLRRLFVFLGQAEVVAQQATEAAQSRLKAEVPVDECLADQFLLPMALAGGGSLRMVAPSSHATTNATIIERFLPLAIRFERENELPWRATVGAR
jgi:RNA 3'-terminal phosphate cyclase (ATP)